MWKRKLWKRINFCGSGSTLKKLEANLEAFFIKHGTEMWKRKLEAVKSLWKRKHFKERSWKWKQKILYCFHIPGCNSLEYLSFRIVQ